MDTTIDSPNSYIEEGRDMCSNRGFLLQYHAEPRCGAEPQGGRALVPWVFMGTSMSLMNPRKAVLLMVLKSSLENMDINAFPCWVVSLRQR